MSISSEVLYKSAQWCLIALVFLLPVWFLPTTINPVEFNKVLMVSILVFLSFILFLACFGVDFPLGRGSLGAWIRTNQFFSNGYFLFDERHDYAAFFRRPLAH